MKRFLAYAAVVVALVALTGPASAQYSTGSSNTTNQNMTTPSNTSTSTTTTTAPSSTATQGTVDQNATTPTSTSTDNTSTMPRTASPLPLIALSGALTLLAGMWISRRHRSA